MTTSTYARLSLRRLTTALAIVGCLPASIAHAQVDCPGDYQIVDYFKPPVSDYPKYLNQGGFRLSLCNGPHGPRASDGACTDIDLKGYLFLPSRGGASPFVGPVLRTQPAAAVDTIGTTAHGLPLIIYAEGSFEGPEGLDSVYPASCEQGRYFTGQGFAFLQIIRRGYAPSTGENELLHKGDILQYLANSSFEVHEALTYVRGLRNIDGRRLVDPEAIAVMGHSLGAIQVLFYGDPGNVQPLKDACQCTEPQLIAKAKVLIAPSSQSWDGFDNDDGVLDDESLQIERLKTAAMNSQLPSYYLEPLNDASSRPAVVLGKAAGDRFLEANRACRAFIRETAGPGEDSDTIARRIVDTCVLAGTEYQSALFPAVDLTPFPGRDSAHGPFVKQPTQIARWGPSVVEFVGRYGVK
jgi:hypothetical protein